MINREISGREDIKQFVTEFYQRLLNDVELCHFFAHIVKQNHLEEHLDTIVDFWEDILFLSTKYGKNAMQPHILLHQKHPIKKKHLGRWLKHFNTSIDNHFCGEKAELAKNRAKSIATIMQIKLLY